MMARALGRTILRGLIVLALGAGLSGGPAPSPPRVLPKAVEERSAAVRTAPDYTPLRAAMLRFIAGYPGIRYGIYFKDLISGADFGINEWEVFPAASTIKVPLVLYLNELVAAGKLDWQDKVVYMSELDWQGGAGALQFFAQDGYKYSLRVLANLT
ncbi:MAG: class A beta-lactamase-related serine hydrolase, partial [Firmicutes bacterium]|nr:class A beta-lactamase-related serine hydrolase [Bacillota bacterium]